MQIWFHEVLTKENKQENTRPCGALVELVCVLTIKPISLDDPKRSFPT